MTAMTTSTTRRVRSIGTVLTIALLASGCAAGERESPASPAEPVRAYLEAIAAGDARTAWSLDDLALRITSAGPDDLDLETLRTDDVLEGAVERISTVEVADPVSDERRDPVDVDYSYTLAGEDYSGALTVGWDSKTQEWQLQEALSGRLAVQASTGDDDGDAVPIGFALPGSTVVAAADAASEYVAYPAVYEITADLDAASDDVWMATVLDGQRTLTDYRVSPDEAP